MARLANNDIEMNALSGAMDGEALFRLGLVYATGRAVEIDRISAHKWFNLAIAKGYRAATNYRQEIAGEMKQDEIAEALRQARAYLSIH
ncbi:SEL1-like repeat protein [Candidatus Raskinella chloraquaticus]|jgi:uncharacterized protein|uniref:Sel1 repeat protein n=1 Tax=Candidatus Raskinella chloraquaticus TaxID=1951219 RepID=A0A1W9I4P6_9HYPH|nr:MAG: hypothetical protein A4S15_14360 [Proteobacteria bacterium SG_bin8]